MDLLNAAVNAAVVALVGLLLSVQIGADARNRRREMDQLREVLRGIRAEVAALRADLTQVALAVGAGPARGAERG
jgi:hypothetical protein